MKEKIQAAIDYLEDVETFIEGGEYHGIGNEYTPSEEMKLAQDLKVYKNLSENIITLALLFIEKAHHRDGCQKARENWKECTCGKDRFLELVYKCTNNSIDKNQ